MDPAVFFSWMGFIMAINMKIMFGDISELI